MGDGVFTAASFVNGVAPEAATTRTDIDVLVGDPLVSENHRFKELEAPGAPYRLGNRADHVTKFWPRAKVAYDELPLSDSTPIAGTTAGEFWQREVHRRRRILARANKIAYVVRGFGDPAPTQADLDAARRFVAEFKDAPEPEPGPLARVSYQRSQTAGVAMDEAAGVGVRVRAAEADTSAEDERARQARINAAPMYRDGKPITEEE